MDSRSIAQSPLPWFLSHRFPRTVVVLSALWACFAAYSTLTRPLLVVETLGHRLTEDSRLTRPVDDLSNYALQYFPHRFADGVIPYQIHSGDTYIFATRRKMVDENRTLEFDHFAAVWFRDGESDDAVPVTLECDSARVDFSSPLDMAEFRVGKITGGSLQGEVRITGPDDLIIEGRNFEFSDRAMLIWSEHQVVFHSGKNSGRANGLQLSLAADASGTSHDSVLGASRIRRLQLRRDVRMRLLAKDERDEQQEIPVIVQSDGSFEFDFDTNEARFDNEVHVHRPTGPGVADSIHCDLLRLIFEAEDDALNNQPAPQADRVAAVDSPVPAGDPKAKSVRSNKRRLKVPSGPGGERQGDEGPFNGLKFRMMIAEGKQVRLESEENNLIGLMTYVTYHPEQRRTELVDTVDTVRIQQEFNTIECPSIVLLHTADGQLDSVQCDGRGLLSRMNTESGEVEFKAEWDEQCRTEPDQQPGVRLITIKRNAVVNQPSRSMTVKADLLQVWIDDTQATASQVASKVSTRPVNKRRSRSRSDRNSPDDADERNSFRPRAVVATGNVYIDTPQMQGPTNKLMLDFINDEPVAAGRPATTVNRERPAAGSGFLLASQRQFALSDETDRNGLPVRAVSSPSRFEQFFGNSERRRSEPAAENRQAKSNGSTDKSGRNPQRLVVAADQIRATVLPGENENSVELSELWLTGDVDVQQLRENDEPPFRLTGSWLHVESHDEERRIMHLQGQPATIQDGKQTLQGNELLLDTGSNYAEVDGPGQIQVLVDQGFEGGKLAEPVPLDVTWQERMTFDGRIARFFGSVAAVFEQESTGGSTSQATLGNIASVGSMKAPRLDEPSPLPSVTRQSLHCAEMDVTFTRPISFTGISAGSDGQRDNTAAQLNDIVCRDDVRIESVESRDKQLLETRTVQLGALSINHRTGALSGAGPGWITSWRPDRGDGPELSPTSSVHANSPLETHDTKWTFARIDFIGRITGDIHKRYTTFHHDVEIIYGPVDRPFATIDPDAVGRHRLPRGAGWLRCDKLNVEQHRTPDTDEAFMVLVGLGNAEVEGEAFEAQADQISFDESKNQFVVSSFGGARATLARPTTVGGRWNTFTAQKFTIVPDKKIFEASDAGSIFGQQ